MSALGDIFDGDAWARIREVPGQVGIELPEESPGRRRNPDVVAS